MTAPASRNPSRRKSSPRSTGWNRPAAATPAAPAWASPSPARWPAPMAATWCWRTGRRAGCGRRWCCRGEFLPPEERRQFRQRLLRRLFGEVMPAVEGTAGDLGLADPAPCLQHVEPPVHHGALAPQGERRAGELATGGAVLAVMDEVDGGGGAVILAHRVDRRGVAEAAEIFAQRLLAEGGAAGAPGADLALQVEVRVLPDHMLRKTVGLDQEVPVIVARRDFLVGGLEQGQSRHDVEHGKGGDPRRVVQRQPVADPAAAVVAG